MLKNPISRNLAGTLLLLLALMLLPMLACGSETTPEKVGEVGEATTAPEATADDEAAEPAAPGEAPADEAPAEAAAEPTGAPSTDEPATAPTPASFAVGDVIDMDGLTMVVLGWSTPPGDDFTQPEPGNQFVSVDVLFVNSGERADSLSSFLQMQLKDGDSRVYDVDISGSMAAGASAPDGEIAPGECIRGSVGFQVPTDAADLLFVFDGDLIGAGKVFVALPAE